MNKFLLFTLFFITSLFSFSQTSWELLNPRPSYQTGLDIHFLSDEHGYIITKNEILETTDAGTTWQLKQTFSDFDLSITDFAFSDTLGFIISINGVVLKTVDSGNTWTKIDIGLGSYDYQMLNTVNIVDGVIIISSVHKLYKSFDGGVTWQYLDITNEKERVTTTFFTSANIGHAACNSGTILKTIDGGLNWYSTEKKSRSSSNFTKIYFFNENIGYASQEHSTLLKTEDGGESWSFSASFRGNSIYSMTFINENIGYIGGENGSLYKTIDGGDNWEQISSQISRGDFEDIYGLCFLDENIGYAVGSRGRIYKTIDGGDSWTQYSVTYFGISQIDFPTSKIGYALVGNEIFKTKDAGRNWKSLGPPIKNEETNSFVFLNKKIGYAIVGGDIDNSSSSKYVYKTSNGGITWTPTNNGDPVARSADRSINDISIVRSFDLRNIDFINKKTGFAGADENLMFQTNDGGKSWSKLSDVSFYKMQFISEKVGYAIERLRKVIHKTTDGGKTWKVSFEAIDVIKDFHFINADNGYLVGDDGLIFKTQDGGTNWEKLNIPYENYEIVEFITKDIGYVVADRIIYKTTDGGKTWKESFEVNTINDICFTKNKVYAAGTYGKILSSNLSSHKKKITKNP